MAKQKHLDNMIDLAMKLLICSALSVGIFFCLLKALAPKANNAEQITTKKGYILQDMPDETE